MTTKETAEARAKEIENRIIETVQSGRSFRIEAGAGAGKTYSLERVVDWLGKEKRKEFQRNGQSVACITYTNAAVDVIASRLPTNSFIHPSTIHTFAWNLIKQFQSSLIASVIELDLLPKKKGVAEKKIDSRDIHHVSYTLGVRYYEDHVLYLFHDDVIQIFAHFLDFQKFRAMLSKKYPIILIDEYQDSFKIIMDRFLKNYISKGIGPQFGLFGDSWQTIYSSQGACGLVEDDNLVVINKETNFRSQQVIVDALNKIRPDLPQISASDNCDGKIEVITTNEFDYSHRISKGYYKDELEDALLFDCITKVSEKKDVEWNEKTKKLMLTHKLLAKMQGYSDVLNLLGDHLKNKDDEHFLFFQNKVEPVYQALELKDTKRLFEALEIERRPIESKSDKHQWTVLKDALCKARKKTIGDVLQVVSDSELIGIPSEVEFWMTQAKDHDTKDLYYGKPINEFYNVAYSEIIKAIDFFGPEAEFSTDHGVKGEQYDNVLIVIGRGWNDYKFDEQLYLNPALLSEKELKTYIRNRNLFYVCCSRPKKNLTILITVPVNDSFKNYLCKVFGKDSLISYSEFVNNCFKK
ncbi:ATP-dependent helicase [Erysipelotrichaceae bacterium Oil+RF-744-GAM-WT-6]|uniref:ATP-dependent helicase n=1 Tax=Stecheria intestinalis TaxID=2606630 RepID=A0A7X2TGU5_9FIRM|nr:UvrD-helicase domain-containing protein [Stecheria intestinalis]MSS59585.1 ATP-dependent helicase [Stecheria intestinalis]